ncbi:MAG: 4-amino-4-deoxy-L-arabinose-phospho-UDP flippase [Burkholderiales bacterium]|jgi:undecaprenyl phosphate-alpha-L-ara4N flippase subunit ArnF|nr:4-amino-4-deoxy-L-arabinose-phospho-UDP flippase [Burkholderiales bacterium]
MKGTAWALVSIVLVSAAQLLMKWGMAQLPPVSAALLVAESSIFHAHQIALLSVVAGIVLYALSMLCWLKVLHALPLGRAYPLLSLSYVLVAVTAAVLPCFNEPLTLLKIAGIALILIGIWFINTREEKTPSTI